MKLILRLLNIIFVALGVIFLVLVLILSYVWIADPFQIRSYGMSPMSAIKVITGDTGVAIDKVDKNPLLTEQQEAQLEAFGIDPASLPTKVTPEMTACFKVKLGEQRTKEIIDGASPSASDYMKASSCFK